jgi:hypothetical protein
MDQNQKKPRTTTKRKLDEEQELEERQEQNKRRKPTIKRINETQAFLYTCG